MRELLSPAFSGSRVKNVIPAVERVCQKVKNYITENGTVDILNLMTRAVTDIISMWTFSGTVDSINDEINPNDFFEASHQLSASAIKHLCIFFFPSVMKLLKIKFIDSKSVKFFRRLVKEIENFRETAPNVPNNFFQFLLNIKNDCE